MNRELKFRAWDDTRMIYRGIHDRNWYTEDKMGVLVKSTHPNDHKMVIMQFTGLIDKNGKEIYEGDILNVSNMEFSHFENSGIPDSPNEIFVDIQGEVTFNKGQFEVGGHSLGEIPLSAIETIDKEVIGNIYEHPNLLKP